MPPIRDRPKAQPNAIPVGRPKRKVGEKQKVEKPVVDVQKQEQENAEIEEIPDESLDLEGTSHRVIRVSKTGDIILDVRFENTRACTKSIPSETIQKLKLSKEPFPSARVFYRVRLDVLKQHSKYFERLLGSDVFGEGQIVSAKLAEFAQSKLDPSTLPANELPRIKIVDEDEATRTLGREAIFQDMLSILHATNHSSKTINLLYLSILVIMADRYDCMTTVSRYITSKFSSFRYPPTLEKTLEEVVRQKILIFYHTNQAPRFATATKELILRGSSRWTVYEDVDPDVGAAWWDLPEDLEAELSYRRSRILVTISSLQNYFLSLYTSRTRQCSLGYDSSPACDSFQLGEMIKFLTRKNLLSLVPFQVVPPEDPAFIWPVAYTSDIEQLVSTLRQCPSYQIDKNHGHCGLRSKLLPALDYIKDCLDTGIGLHVRLWKSERSSQTWVPVSSTNGSSLKKAFVVGDKIVGEEKKEKSFDFTSLTREDLVFGGKALGADKAARKLFSAESWIWIREIDKEKERMAKSSVFRF
ncbi:hydroxyproline-rich glyco protein [Rutstroemia sp. NJR-2017a BVV2]|nr:hydroxyproline-rich glyco protein [Rutstroemia sp. NJR-2017a BVV2]